MAYNLITDGFRVNQAEQFLESFTEKENNVYYTFFGNHVPWSGGVVPQVSSSVSDVDINAYSNMIFAKRIGDDDISLAIRRNDYVANRVYQPYDHRTETGEYVGVLEGTNYNVFKCLFNNGGQPSTVAPSFAAFSLVEDILTDTYDGYYETSDGYQWKYMYSVDATTLDKFGTTRYVPLVANTAVVNFAAPGSIDVILVENGGVGYDNHFNGEFFANSDVAFMGNNNYFAIRNSGNATPSSLNDFYNGCIMKITFGKGAGQYREVVDYVNNGNARYVVLDDTFSIMPDTTSAFEITPKVEVQGRYRERAVGRAIVDPTSNSISKVEVLNGGIGYIQATAKAIAANVISVSNNATLIPIIPPPGGHGSNPAVELNARWVSINTKVIGDENATIPTGQKFAQVGILRDPLFGNVEVTTVRMSNNDIIGRDGGFAEGETVIGFDPVAFDGWVADIEEDSDTITIPTASDVAPVAVGMRVYVQSSNPDNGWYTGIVQDVIPVGKQIVLDRMSPWLDSSASIFWSRDEVEMVHRSSGPGWSYMTNVSPETRNGMSLMGIDTYSTAKITGFQINNSNLNNFDVVNQLSVVSIDDPNGTFVDDEFLSDAEGINTCYVHSYANVNHLYVTRVTGNMDAGTVLRNPSMSASITVANKYDGQMLPGSGTVIYLENHDPVSRQTSTSQTKKIIVEF